MTDYSEHGTIPVEDAVVDDPPTVDEVMERQRREYPDLAATAQHGSPAMDRPGAMREGGEDGDDEVAALTTDGDDEVEALIDAGGTPVAGAGDEVEGPNPA